MNRERAQILDAVRAALGRGAADAATIAEVERRIAQPQPSVIPARGALSGENAVAAFIAEATRVNATVERLASLADVPAACAAYLQTANLPARLKAAPHPALEAAPWASQPLLSVAFGAADPADEVGLSHAFAAVAETGTLVVLSGPDQPTLLNFLPERAIVLVPAGRIVGCYEEVFAMLRRERAAMPRTVNWITGQSRTADIEQTLLLGAHGPKHLHILVVDGQSGT